MNATSTSQTSATVGAADSVILGTNPTRKRLTISPPSAGRVTITFGSAATLDAGETIYTATSPRTWSAEELGERITSEVHAIADAGGRVIGIVEAFEPRG